MACFLPREMSNYFPIIVGFFMTDVSVRYLIETFLNATKDNGDCKRKEPLM